MENSSVTGERPASPSIVHLPWPQELQNSITFHILVLVAWTWAAVGFFAFISGVLISEAGAPKWLPLPWSDFYDFAESTDGKVYVSIAFYRRVLCYDAQGRFLTSYRAPSYGRFGGVQLASDLKDRIFCCTGGSIYHLMVYDSSWHILADYQKQYKDGIDWRLDENYEPVLDPSWRSAPVVDRAAGPGEYIFSKYQHRNSFTCMDGSRLVKKGNHLERYSEDGHLLARYSGPLILYPLTFPWPASTALLVAMLYAYVAWRIKRLPQQLGATGLGRILLLDVVATSIVTLVSVAVWFKGTALLINANNAQPDNSPWRSWLLVLTIVWFFLIAFAGFMAWKALQKRLEKLSPQIKESTSTASTVNSTKESTTGASAGLSKGAQEE